MVQWFSHEKYKKEYEEMTHSFYKFYKLQKML